MLKKGLSLSICLLLLLSLSSCAVTEKIIYKDIPEGYIVIKKSDLDKSLSELIRTKMELLECLEREKQK